MNTVLIRGGSYVKSRRSLPVGGDLHRQGRLSSTARDARNIERSSRDYQGVELGIPLHQKDFETRVSCHGENTCRQKI